MSPVADERGQKGNPLRNSVKFKRLREQSKKRKTEDNESHQVSVSLNETIKLFGKLIEHTVETPSKSASMKKNLDIVGEMSPTTESKKPRPGLDKVPEQYYMEPIPFALEGKDVKDKRIYTEPTVLNSSSIFMINKATINLRSKLERMFDSNSVKQSLELKLDGPTHQSLATKPTVQRVKSKRSRLILETKEEDWVKSMSHKSIERKDIYTPRMAQNKQDVRDLLREGAGPKKVEIISKKETTTNRKISTPNMLKKEYSSVNQIPVATNTPLPTKPNRPKRDVAQRVSCGTPTDRDVSGIQTHQAYKMLGRKSFKADCLDKFRLEVSKLSTTFDTVSKQLRAVQPTPAHISKNSNFDKKVKK